MIVGPRFIWLHFPKCGGTEIENVLRQHFDDCPSLRFDALDPANVIWHHGVEERLAFDPGFDVGGREIVCGIRRLPHWLLSRLVYEWSRSGQAPDRERFLAGVVLEPNGKANRADDYMEHYLRSGGVDTWIRTEFLCRDFKTAFAPHLDLSKIDFAADFLRLNAQIYIADPAFYFTSAELTHLYARNPVWAQVEEQVYGDLLTLPRRVPAMPPSDA